MNIIYIHSHDTGKLVSPYGYNLPTPNLEEFASNALKFNNYFSASPTCTPSRGAVMTGTYPSKNGLIGLCQRGFSLLNPKWHIANVLKDNNYHTVLSGVQHEATRYEQIDYEALNLIGYEQIITKKLSGDFKKWDYDNLDASLEFLQNYNSDKPFFLSHGVFSTHRPFYTEPNVSKSTYYKHSKFTNKEIIEDENNYHNSVYVLDDIIGQLLNKIDDLNLTQKTLIIVSTDHGAPYPLEKGLLSDEGTAIMLLIANPNKADTFGKESSSLLCNIDLLPTILDIVGIDKPDYLDGKSFVKIFDDVDYKVNDYIFSEMNFHTAYEPSISIRTQRYRLTKFLSNDYDKISFCNSDPSPAKDLLFNSLDEYVKNTEIFTDYLVRNKEAVINIDETQVKNKLEHILVDFDLKRSKLFRETDEFKANYGVNKNSDYDDYLEGFPGWDELEF